MRLDVHTGKVVEKPRRLTNWTGFCIYNANVSADGKRLTFLRGNSHGTVYTADLEARGTRLENLRHFTLDENNSSAQDWTNDSKSIVFTSNRTGQSAIYKQSLYDNAPDLISKGTDSFRDTPVTPDGNWVLAITWPKPGDSKEPDRLMRIPLKGGLPELVTTTLQGAIFCARPPATLCVLGERTEDRKELIFTSIDPLKGRGGELTRFDVDPAVAQWLFDVSPDGTRLAVSNNLQGPIHILSLRGHAEQMIPAKFSYLMGNFFWAADGKGLYVSGRMKGRAVLL
jgi:dipeptidyl aminopeptidase/acylaminoacyl peptidase